MARFDDSFKNEVREKINLINYAGRYLRLEKSGASYKACCPFHNEKTPSFHVREEYYHCFGCGESGDIFSFVMKYENLDFLSALKLLADHAGLEMPDTGYDSSVHEQKRSKERLIALMVDAGRRYVQNLRADDGIAAEYLARRGLSRQTVTKFGLGYSKNYDEMIGYLRNKGYTDTEIIDSSIGTMRDNGALYDNFGGRLLFPIINSFGELIAFGGRRLVDNDSAKYYNSRATALFDKSKTIYGINFLKKKKQARQETVPILVEGYMDVIALHTAGFDTAVASMGTSLTKEQARQLKWYSDTVYISYDGDSAGQSATLKGLDLLAEQGINVRVIELPEGLDPDDVIKNKGSEYYKKLMDNALSLLDFKLKTARRGLDLSVKEDSTKYVVAAAAVLAGAEPIVQDEYVRQISRETGYTVDAIKKQVIKDYIAPKETAPQNQGAPSRPSIENESAFLLSAMYRKRPFVDLTFDLMPLLTSQEEKDLYFYLKECYSKDKQPVATAVMDLFEDKSKATEIIDFTMTGNEEKKYTDYIRRARFALLKRERAELSQKYDAADTQEARTLLSLKISKIDSEIRNGGT